MAVKYGFGALQIRCDTMTVACQRDPETSLSSMLTRIVFARFAVCDGGFFSGDIFSPPDITVVCVVVVAAVIGATTGNGTKLASVCQIQG